jgi:hypothetical protein
MSFLISNNVDLVGNKSNKDLYVNIKGKTLENEIFVNLSFLFNISGEKLYLSNKFRIFDDISKEYYYLYPSKDLYINSFKVDFIKLVNILFNKNHKNKFNLNSFISPYIKNPKFINNDKYIVTKENNSFSNPEFEKYYIS